MLSPNANIFGPIVKRYRQTGFLHHAYLVTGDPAIVLGEASILVAAVFGLKPDRLTLSHPDLLRLYRPRFGIDESRLVRHHATRKASNSIKNESRRRLFLLGAEAITADAQNALLKTLEDPGRACFVFVAGPRARLLPTFVSRFERIVFRETDLPTNDANVEDYHWILREPLVRCFEQIKKILDSSDGREVEVAEAILSWLEKELAPSARGAGNDSALPVQVVKEIWRLKRYLRMTGGSPRLALESAAVSLRLFINPSGKPTLDRVR